MAQRNRPPKAGESISARFLAWISGRLDRQRIRPVAPLYARETDGGTIVGIRLDTLRLARSTSTITAATYSGASITAFGSGTADLYDMTLSAVGGSKQAAPNADKGVPVLCVGTSTIASGTTILLGHLFGEAAGYVVLGKVC